MTLPARPRVTSSFEEARPRGVEGGDVEEAEYFPPRQVVVDVFLNVAGRAAEAITSAGQPLLCLPPSLPLHLSFTLSPSPSTPLLPSPVGGGDAAH